MEIEYNKNFDKLSENYLFSTIRKRKAAYQSLHPDQYIINLGVGDVILPLSKRVVDVIKNAADDYANIKTFKGYPVDFGYDFLKERIVEYYSRWDVHLRFDEIFVSDGAKSDLGNITDIFGGITALIPTPVYPVYVDSNIIAGNKIRFLQTSAKDDFIPIPPKNTDTAYLIYLCSPNNPTGTVLDYYQLENWVQYALKTNSVIIYDNAYESFIQGDYPHSIYEIKGSENCAIEISSFSKRAGFTGLRLGYSVVPYSLFRGRNINKLWARRQSTKFNGVCYIIQKAGAETLTDIGIKECNQKIAYYMQNAFALRHAFENMGYTVYGGLNSPYIWVDCKSDSWHFFDKLLNNYQIIGTAGAGFGKGGEKFFRLSAFATNDDVNLAITRIQKSL